MVVDDPNRLRELRQVLGFSLGDLARRSGVSLGTINRFELAEGPTNMKGTTLAKIAAALGVTPRQLLDPDITMEQLLAASAASSEAGRGSVVYRNGIAVSGQELVESIAAIAQAIARGPHGDSMAKGFLEGVRALYERHPLARGGAEPPSEG